MGDVDALVAYFCRSRQLRHVQAVVEEVAAKRGWEGKLLFWKSYGLGMEGNVNQAIRELDELRRKRDFELAAAEALLYFHASVKLRDEGAISELERSRAALEKSSSDAGVLLTAEFLVEIGEQSRAARLIDSLLEKNPLNIKANTARGWAEARSKSGNGKQAISFFDQALNADRSGKKELNALLGKAFALSQQAKHSESLEILDQVIVSFPWFLPALVEKALTLLSLSRWDMAVETAERVLSQDKNDIGALRLVAMYHVTHASPAQEMLDAVQAVCDALDRFEPENPSLWVEVSKPFARLSQRNAELLRKSIRLVERAKRKMPDNADFATEYAYQLSLAGKVDAAFAAYEHAAQLDESNGSALFGQIYCLVERGELEEASQQLEFMGVLQETLGRSAQVAFLEAKLVWLRDRDRRGSLKLINEAVHLHVKSVQTAGQQSGLYDYLVRFNPEFMLEVAKEYLQHCGSEPIDLSEAAPQHLTNGIKLVEKIIRFVPCMLSAQLTLARARFVANDIEQCVKTTQQVLALDANCSEAHLLMARVQLVQEDYTGAKGSLEQALAHDFKVRENSTYSLVKARVMQATGDLAEAQSLLESILQRKPASTETGGKRDFEASSKLRASAYVDLASVHTQLKQLDKARKVIKTARAEFKDTPEEVALIIAEADTALRRKDSKSALRLLSEVPQDSPSFNKAMIAKADIYLTHRNDTEAFIKCYAELAELSPSNSHAYLLLGEAYMRVNMSDEAIDAFSEALKRNPKDSQLAKRIGKVLVSMHDYQRAIEYYKSALRGSSGAGVRYDLAELYLNLGKYAKAEKELLSIVSSTEGGGDADGSDENANGSSRANNNNDGPSGSVDLAAQVRALHLLAKVYEAQSETSKVTDVLNQARETQLRIFNSVKGSSSSSAEAIQQARKEMAEACILVAKHLEQQVDASVPPMAKKEKDTSPPSPDRSEEKDGGAGAEPPQERVISAVEREAVELYNEALRHDGGNVPALLALARLYQRCGDLERCHTQCVTILRVDEHNEEASMMLADILFQRSEFKVSIFHYQQLLERNPCNFHALTKLVTLLHRAGDLEAAKHFFELAQHKAPWVLHDPGFCFARGLFLRLSNEVNEAVAEFNKARRDVVWGERALTKMIEIYLNPDNANFWEPQEDPSQQQQQQQQQPTDASVNLDAIRTAFKLLEELPAEKESTTILRCYATMASRNKSDVEKAFQQLVEIVQERPDDVPSLLALSTALMMMKQTPKARNQLKRISKMEYKQSLADEFERCWLLLADISIEGGKYDLAQGLCKRCLQYNRSCAKAWECMGLIMEKESANGQAAEHYEQAWRLQKMASASTGYKLAFNYLKAKRYVEAIDVSNKVLKQFPQYPKIKKEILDKARTSIRS